MTDSHSIPARYYDGRTSAAQDVVITLGATLSIAGNDGVPIAAWPLDDIESVTRDDTGAVRIARAASAATILCNDRNFYRALRKRGAGRGRAGRGGRGVRLAAWIAGAAASVALFFVFGLPFLSERIAHGLPEAWERELGDSIVAQVDGAFSGTATRVCNATGGQAALTDLTGRLTAVTPPRIPPVVTVLNLPMVNAFALPGGQVVVFRGLLDNAEHPNELAAVLAHEFAHNDLRHPVEIAVERGAGAFVVGLLFGDIFGIATVGTLVQVMVSAGYTREAENEADAQMAETLRAAGLAGPPAARFFDRLAEQTGEVPTVLAWLNTHPALAERRELLRAIQPDGDTALDTESWAALKAICGPPAAESAE